jgi:hypothetical protein
MKSFRNAFLVTAVASATLLGWGCRERGEGQTGTQEEAGQPGTGGAGGTGGDVGGTGGGTGSGVEDRGGTGGAGDIDERGDMGPGEQGDEIGGGTQEDTGSQIGTEPDTRR